MTYLIYPSPINIGPKSTCNCYSGSVRSCDYTDICIIRDSCGTNCSSDCWALICGAGVARRITTG